jgi:hypothetical protein
MSPLTDKLGTSRALKKTMLKPTGQRSPVLEGGVNSGTGMDIPSLLEPADQFSPSRQSTVLSAHQNTLRHPPAPEVDLHLAVSTHSSVMRERHKDLKKFEDAVHVRDG